MQRHHFIARHTFRPQQARTFRLWPVTDMLEGQHEWAKPLGYKAKPIDCFGYGSFIPWWHERQVDIGGRDEPNREWFQSADKLRELACDLSCNLQADKDAGGLIGIRWRSDRGVGKICHR